MSAKLRYLVLVVLLLAAVGCGQQEEAPTVQPAARPEKQPLQVLVPEEVQGQWTAVKIAVKDKETDREEVYTVQIGSTFAVADDGLELEVKGFLPAFIMDGSVMTSASNETSNPGAQVVIREGGQEVFKGWLFSRYPAAHAFQHPRYTFALVDFVPTGGKKD